MRTCRWPISASRDLHGARRHCSRPGVYSPPTAPGLLGTSSAGLVVSVELNGEHGGNAARALSRVLRCGTEARDRSCAMQRGECAPPVGARLRFGRGQPAKSTRREALSLAVRSVNSAMVLAYWQIGRELASSSKAHDSSSTENRCWSGFRRGNE